MKIFGICALFLSLFLSAGCSSTATNEEKEAYYEEGKMTEQVESWKKHGRH